MEQSILKVEHLSHRYTIQWAVRDISLDIKGKGIYGLLGSNGAGKSTLMNIVCGVLKPTEGEVLIDGINIAENPVEAKRRIGFLPQRPPLYTDLTVEECLAYCASLRWVPEDEVATAVEEVMERCGVSHFRKRLIRNLSGGYQQRVGIAQAIIHKPKLVVFDEPTNGLDPNQILEVRRLITDIAENHTVILSTHILSEVQATCNHIYMVEEGSIVFSGTVSDFDNYIAPNSLVATITQLPSADDLKQIEGVTGAEDLGGHRYRVTFSSEPDAIASQLVRQSVACDWNLIEIGIEKNSLDSVFAELSKKN